MGQKPCPGEALGLHNCGRFPNTTSLHQYIITSQYHNMTTRQHHSVRKSQHHGITTSLHHSITTSRHHNTISWNTTTSLQPYNTTSFFGSVKVMSLSGCSWFPCACFFMLGIFVRVIFLLSCVLVPSKLLPFSLVFGHFREIPEK